MIRLSFTAIVLTCVLPAMAGKYNPTLSIGDAAPQWKSLPGTDGKAHSPAESKDAKVVVLAFTCNTCPYAVDYEERLIALARSLEGKPAQLLVINCNSGKADALDAMKARAKDKGFSFPYLKDETGTVGKAFGATRTPEFVVLDENRKVVYLGAMDDDASGKKVTAHYVEDAVAAALAGKAPTVSETPPIGCNIKYPRERRREE
jgi:peroxiredoxin